MSTDRPGSRSNPTGTADPAASTQRLQGARVLIVEDEALVAMLAEEALRDQGCDIVGPVGRLDDAIRLASEADLDAAILDVNLAGQPVYPAADPLMRRGIPFAFMTGYGSTEHPERYRAHANLAKPYRPEDLVRTVRNLICPVPDRHRDGRTIDR